MFRTLKRNMYEMPPNCSLGVLMIVNAVIVWNNPMGP